MGPGRIQACFSSSSACQDTPVKAMCYYNCFCTTGNTCVHCPPVMQAKLEPTGRRPATMERAAEADAAVDRLEEEQAAAATGCQHCHAAACNGSQAESSGCGSSSADAQSERTQQQATAAAAAQKKKFGVGASDDVDASYAASQRLLTLAGVKLRQHRLQRSIYLGP